MDPDASLFADLAPSEPGPPQGEVGLKTLFVDIVRRPSTAMRQLTDHPGRRWFWPVLVLALVTTAANVAGLPASQRFARQVALEEAQRMVEDQGETIGDQTAEDIASVTSGGIFAAIGAGRAVAGGLLGVAIAVLAVAAVFHFLGTVLGGQQTYTQMLTAVSWAHVAFIPREVMRLGYHLLGRWDASPAGLSGLVAADPFDPEAQASLVGPVLAQIEVWNGWYWLLLVVGITVVCHVSRRKAVIAVATVVVVQILLGLGSVFAARFIGSAFGG